MQAIKDALKRLVELMEEWQVILTEKARGTFHEPVSSAAAKSAPVYLLLCCHLRWIMALSVFCLGFSASACDMLACKQGLHHCLIG